MTLKPTYQQIRSQVITYSGVNSSVTLGGWTDAKGKAYGGRKSPSGVQGQRPKGGLVDEPPKLILIWEIDVKLIFYGRKIESAYTDIQLTVRIGEGGMVW